MIFKNILLPVLIAGSLFGSLKTNGQGTQQPIFQSDVPALSVGDKVPDLLLEKVISNGRTAPRNLYDFDDRLLIIDFWSTYCTGCIKSFPKLDSLQHIFGDRMHILLSTYQTERVVKAFMTKNAIAKKVNLPSVVEDDVLGAHFPHRSIPHVVWLRRGEVIAITGTEYITEENIEAALSGGLIGWPVKNERLGYDYKQPLLQLTTNRQFTDTKLQYTALMGYQDGLSGKLDIVVDTALGTRRGYLINLPIVNAYFLLHHKTMDIFSLKRPHIFITPNQLVVEGTDLNKYWYNRQVSGYHAAWEREHDITMEVVMPDSNQNDTTVYRFMIAELDRLLGIEAGFERRRVDCLVLKPLADSDQDAVSSSDSDAALQAILGRQSPAAGFVYRVNLPTSNPPAFDESGYTGELDIDVDDWTDIGAINRQLQSFGLRFVRAYREVDMFVVRKTR